jgi:lipase
MGTLGQALPRTGEALDVPVSGGDLRVVRWGEGSSVVVGLPGLTGNHTLLWPFAKRVSDDVTFVAPDMRGRGASAHLPGPYGMQAHVDDLVATLDHLGIASATVVGISMGGMPATMAASQFPDRVDHVVFVDSGFPVPLPPGTDVERHIENMLGPSIERLRMTFPSREAYFDFWRAHPSLQDTWNEDVEAYIDYDLVGEEPELRSGVNPDAILGDTTDTLRNPDRQLASIERVNCPVTLLRATRGVLNEPQPLFPDEVVDTHRSLFKDLRDEVIEDTNHFSIVFDERPASIVAERIMAALPSR